MNNDELLRKALKSQQTTLPANFNSLLMNKITAQAARKEKEKLWLGYAVAALVSLLLIALSVYLFFGKVSAPSPAAMFSQLKFNFDSTLLRFSIFIAAIMLFLLLIDTLVRNMYQKHRS